MRNAFKCGCTQRQRITGQCVTQTWVGRKVGGEEEAAAACVNSPIFLHLTVTHHSTHITTLLGRGSKRRGVVRRRRRTRTRTRARKLATRTRNKSLGESQHLKAKKEHMSDMSGIQMQAAKAGSRMWGPRQRAGPKIPEDAKEGRHMALKWSLFLTSEDMKHMMFHMRHMVLIPNPSTSVPHAHLQIL